MSRTLARVQYVLMFPHASCGIALSRLLSSVGTSLSFGGGDMDNNAFGKLIRDCREEHQWKQEELAERWGFTRQYVSLIERGKRKLDRPEQVTRLADILSITEEQLIHTGKKRPPERPVQQSAENNDLLLRALLQSAENIVKLSWSIWQNRPLTGDLSRLERRLSEDLLSYRGPFRQPTLHLLAFLHECLGNQAIDQMADGEASDHFQQMYDIAEELGDRDLLCLAMIHQAEMFRRMRRFEFSFRRLEAAERRAAPQWLQGLVWQNYARTFSVYGDEQGFLRAIDRAESIAERIEAPMHPFDKVSVLQERAQGYTLLWQPEKAIAICQKIDQMRPFRPLREQSSYHILKAQAYCSHGDQRGIEHALTGLRMAEILQSKRYVRRLQQMCDRLIDKHMGRTPAMQDLRREILTTWDKLSHHNSSTMQ